MNIKKSWLGRITESSLNDTIGRSDMTTITTCLWHNGTLYIFSFSTWNDNVYPAIQSTADMQILRYSWLALECICWKDSDIIAVHAVMIRRREWEGALYVAISPTWFHRLRSIQGQRYQLTTRKSLVDPSSVPISRQFHLSAQTLPWRTCRVNPTGLNSSQGNPLFSLPCQWSKRYSWSK
jgi:hypothetical protein